MAYGFFHKKTGSGTKTNVNEVPPQELHKPGLKCSEEGKSMQGLRKTSSQQI